MMAVPLFALFYIGRVATEGKKVQAVPSPVMTVAEVCEFLRINRSTLYRLLKAHKIPSFRVGLSTPE